MTPPRNTLESPRAAWKSRAACLPAVAASAWLDSLQAATASRDSSAGCDKFREALRALRGETEPELFFQEILSLGREQAVHGDAARSLLIFHWASQHAPDAEIRARAESELARGQGGGFEAQLGNMAAQISDYRTLLPMLAGTVAFQAGKALAMARWAPGAGRLKIAAAELFGGAVETGVFTAGTRALHADRVASFGEDLVDAARLIGAMKVSGYLSSKIFRGLHRVDAFGQAQRWRRLAPYSQELLSHLGLTAGIKLAHAGIRPITWLDAAALGINLAAGSELGRRFIGRRFADFEREAEQRVVQSHIPASHPALRPWMSVFWMAMGAGLGGFDGISRQKVAGLKRKIANANRPFFQTIEPETAGRAQQAWGDLRKIYRTVNCYFLGKMELWQPSWEHGFDPLITLHNTGAHSVQIIQLLGGHGSGGFPLTMERRLDLPSGFHRKALRQFALDRMQPNYTFELALPFSQWVIWLAEHREAWMHFRGGGDFAVLEAGALKSLIADTAKPGSIKILELPSLADPPKLRARIRQGMLGLGLPETALIQGVGPNFEAILGMAESERDRALSEWSQPLAEDLQRQQSRLADVLAEAAWLGFRDKRAEEIFEYGYRRLVSNEITKWYAPYPVVPHWESVHERIEDRLIRERGIDPMKLPIRP